MFLGSGSGGFVFLFTAFCFKLPSRLYKCQQFRYLITILQISFLFPVFSPSFTLLSLIFFKLAPQPLEYAPAKIELLIEVYSASQDFSVVISRFLLCNCVKQVYRTLIQLLSLFFTQGKSRKNYLEMLYYMLYGSRLLGLSVEFFM